MVVRYPTAVSFAATLSDGKTKIGELDEEFVYDRAWAMCSHSAATPGALQR